MHYRIPCSLHVGPLEKMLEEETGSGVESIIVMTSAAVSEIEYVRDSITRLCEKRRVSVHAVSSEAPLAQVEAVVDQEVTPDLIVGVGGGSAIDAAKALSVSFGKQALRDIYYGRAAVPTESIRTIAVPTTAGTGAEVSCGAILTDEATQTKRGIRGTQLQPDAAIIDARLHQHASARLIAEVGFDCLTHAIETYCSTHSNPAVRYQSVKALLTVLSRLEAAATQKDQESLEQLALAAFFMGVNLVYSRTCLPHRIQYVLGPHTKTSHAQGLVALYRGWLPMISRERVFRELSLHAGFSVRGLCRQIRNLKTRLGIDYTLAELGVSPDETALLAQLVTGDVSADPCFRDRETIETIIRGSL